MWAQSQKSFGTTFTPISIIKSDFELGQNGFPCACYASLPRKLYRSGSAKRSFTPMAEGFFYWLDGYIYGLKATSALDTRIKALIDFGYKDVSAMVLTFCSKNLEDTLISATTAVAEFLVNSQPGGETLNFDWR
jgi:hypothetical protein